jgi:hypothetical protein
MNDKPTLEETVESLMDKHGADKVLAAVAEVLKLKSAHIEDNWQDRPMANRFANAANACWRAADKLSP